MDGQGSQRLFMSKNLCSSLSSFHFEWKNEEVTFLLHSAGLRKLCEKTWKRKTSSWSRHEPQTAVFSELCTGILYFLPEGFENHLRLQFNSKSEQADSCGLTKSWQSCRAEQCSLQSSENKVLLVDFYLL